MRARLSLRAALRQPRTLPEVAECGQPPCDAREAPGSLAVCLRPNALAARLLPKGWVDLLRQIVLFCGAYWLYRLVRGQVDGRVATAFENARDVISIERSLHLFIEPSVHAWATGKEWLIDFASWMYLNSHFAITTMALAWIYLRRNDSFYFVRNMFCVAMGIALVGYMAFPTAPPRMMPEWGFTDSVAQFTGVTTPTPRTRSTTRSPRSRRCTSRSR